MNPVLPVLLALMLIVPPTAATAQEPQTNAPPGNSAIDEYLETVPAAGGNRRPTPPAAGGGRATLTPIERARLERLGADGKLLADAVDATTSPAERATPAQRAASAPAVQGRSPVTEVLEAATGRDGGGGMSLVLAAILLASLLGCIALVVMRRRSLS